MPTLPFAPKRIVVAADSHAGLAAFIRERRPDLEIRDALPANVSAADMEWAEADGYVIYYDHIDPLLEAHPDQFETLVEILRDAVASWKEDGTAMVVLLSGSKAPKRVAKLGAAGGGDE